MRTAFSLYRAGGNGRIVSEVLHNEMFPWTVVDAAR